MVMVHISRSGKIGLKSLVGGYYLPDREKDRNISMPTAVDHEAATFAARAGALIRARRKALGLRLDDLAAATGVGRRFIHDLETGKPSCQIGRALVVAAAVGLRPFDLAPAADTIDLPPAL